MAHKLARVLFLSLFAGLGFGLVNSPVPVSSGRTAGSALWANPARKQAQRVVFLAGNLSHEQLVLLSASLAASRHPGVLLLDSAKSSPYHKLFLSSYRPERVVPVGSFPDGIDDLERRLGMRTSPIMAWEGGAPVQLWQGLFPRATRVVICPARPYRLLLQAACLAGSVQAPLYVVRGAPRATAGAPGATAKELRHLTGIWGTKTVFAVGPVTGLCRSLPDVRVVQLADEESVAEAYLQHQLARGPIRNLVLANPEDFESETSGAESSEQWAAGGREQGAEGNEQCAVSSRLPTADYPLPTAHCSLPIASAMSALAPWIALQKRGVLLLTNKVGDNVAALVKSAVRNRALERVENLILVADLQAIPMERRPNPIPEGKDPFIEMEPLTPTGTEPFTFATGRLFNEDPSVVALVLARERLLKIGNRQSEIGNRKALVASNSAGELPLLETFSRNTAKELRNRGYDTTTLFGSEVNKDDLRRLLPEQEIFLWEGHHNTLIKNYQLPGWTEPLQPSLVFLQSCLALQDYKAQPLLERGALCVVGSSTRIHSGSGGAFALSFFDAMMYENRSLGGALRQSKNFLLAYALLKEKRLGKDARLTAANLRSARSFTLWGDPTLKLPQPEPPEDSLPPVTHKVRGNTIDLLLPDIAHDKATTTKYKAQMLPNGRLAGLINKGMDEERSRLVPFLFAEVSLLHAPAGKIPQLRSRLPSKHWVFCWDSRRRCGYLLVAPRSKDREKLRFHIDWEEPETTLVNK